MGNGEVYTAKAVIPASSGPSYNSVPERELYEKYAQALVYSHFRLIGKEKPRAACGAGDGVVVYGVRRGQTHAFTVVRYGGPCPLAIGVLRGAGGWWGMLSPFEEVELMPELDPVATLMDELRRHGHGG